MDQIVTFLKNNQWSDFYRSVLAQYESKGQLSPRQIECIENAMIRAANRQSVGLKEYSIQPGAIVEVKAWIARRLQADNEMPYFFRNLEVVEIKNETAKAYQLTVKFVSKIVTSCHICGKDLDTDISRATGIGPVCADRLGIRRPTLETAHETLQAIDALCRNLGIIGPLWIPKSQIKTVSNQGGN
jgi:hypothetical protein